MLWLVPKPEGEGVMVQVLDMVLHMVAHTLDMVLHMLDMVPVVMEVRESEHCVDVILFFVQLIPGVDNSIRQVMVAMVILTPTNLMVSPFL